MTKEKTKKLIIILTCVIIGLVAMGFSTWAIVIYALPQPTAEKIEIGNSFVHEMMDGNILAKIVLVDNSPKTYQIDAYLLPQNAKGKITYSTNNEKIATVNKNGLVTFKTNESAAITLTAEGVAPLEVMLAQPIKAKKNELSLEITKEKAKLVNADEKINFVTTDQETAVLIKGIQYQIHTKAELILSNDVATLDKYMLTTNKVGNFEIKIKTTLEKEVVEKVLKVKVIPYIQTFSTSSEYITFQNKLTQREHGKSKLEHANKLMVGKNKNFRFNINMLNNNQEIIDPDIVELKYSVNGNANINEIAVVNADNTLTFLQNTANKTFTISVEPKYNLTKQKAITFTIFIDNDLNVYLK